MDAFEVANGTRGWIMCVVSGIACIAGASIICIDALVRLIPGQKHFRIEESNAFLACSLSLSFGVMIFSALYNMLPAAKRYLLKAGYEDDQAGFIMMACFVGGFIGIQVLSRLLHQLLPSHVVDCDHSHDPDKHEGAHDHDHGMRRPTGFPRQSSKGRAPDDDGTAKANGFYSQNGAMTESTPLLSTESGGHHGEDTHAKGPSERDGGARETSHHNGGHHHNHYPGHMRDHRPKVPSRRKSMQMVRNRVMSFVKDTKPDCGDTSNCFGFTDPCGQECFKHMSSSSALSRQSSIARTASTAAMGGAMFHPRSSFPGVAEDNEEEYHGACSPGHRLSHVEPGDGPVTQTTHLEEHDDHAGHDHDHGHDHHYLHETASQSDMEDLEAQHHHHVPQNAFLSIGLQTVVAIALHKFPEGFITYATNMASPQLGFNVFMALFVHNIAEGFSMALPLYMALGSKAKAVAWSSILGGLSQPAGAAVAWLWFHIANQSHYTIDNTAYAALFAVTAGIMTSVALQLFVESLSLNHNRNLSIAFAFVGMILLGVSSALVEDD